MPLQATAGAATYDAYGSGAAAAVAANYIEDVFQTWLYTGNGSTQTITNGVDLAGKGGLVFTKCRSTGGVTYIPAWVSNDTGLSSFLDSSSTSALGGVAAFGFNSNGFTINTSNSRWNGNADTYVSWTFRKQPKFFDVVTYTGNGSNRTISHSLGSVPGCIIVKDLSTASNWPVYHRSLSSGGFAYLNLTNAAVTSGNTSLWNATDPTSTVFSIGTSSLVNTNGNTYVAYLFAHDAGGFGASGTDNVISCGSFTTDAGGLATVNLGYEPQWLLVKCASNTDNWNMMDVMRGWNMTTQDATLYANLANAESTANWGNPTATGFEASFGASRTFIYIAIRRGPMRTPTTGTSVFASVARTGTNTSVALTGISAGPSDTVVIKQRGNTDFGFVWANRLTEGRYLVSNATDADAGNTAAFPTSQVWDRMDGVNLGNGGTPASSQTNYNPYTYINYLFRRAPGFFDVVCWTSTGAAQTLTHNLGVVPELMIRKVRNGTWEGWMVYAAPIGNTNILYLDQTAAQDPNNGWNNQTPTATQFFVNNTINNYNFVTYLFATVAGVSKVGSYTGTGTTLQVNCGFTGGARFVLIKRTDSTGDWYVWDSARGIVAGNDPYLLLNSTAAEVTSTDYVDTFSSGFEISSTAPAAINANGGTFIFLAVS